MKNLSLFLIISLFTSFHFTAQAKCWSGKRHRILVGQVGQISKFYTPVKNECDSDTLNMFTNCIEAKKKKDTIYFGHLSRAENIEKSQCPFGYAPAINNGMLAYQKYNNQKVCLDPCSSISVGKFFRNEEKFGNKRALNIGDVVYIPELKGKKCGQERLHSGCAVVSQFIEYNNKPILDVYSGACKNIFKGQCLDYKDDKPPQQARLYKLKKRASKKFKKAFMFPKVSKKNLKVMRNPANRNF